MLDLREAAGQRLIAVGDPGRLRDAVLGTWRARMVNEHGSSAVFEALSAQLAAAGLTEEAATSATFAEEERRHGELCGAVVASFGGEALDDALVHPPFPLHPDVDALEGVLRNVLSVCCLSETVAVSLIGAERLEMPEGPLRDLLTKIYADEVGHSRFGWALLDRLAPTLDEAARQRLGRYLSVAFAHLEAHELAHLPVDATPPEEGAAFGLCSGPDARALFFDTVTEVIVPGLARYGLPAAEAWERRRDLSAFEAVVSG